MNLGPMEIGMLLLVMLFAFGPKRIPEIGKSMGEALAGFRKATREEEPPAVGPAPPKASSEEPAP